MVIYKYPLKLVDEQTVEMPNSATLLHVAEQNGQLCLWAMVDPRREVVGVPIVIVGTGNPMGNVGKYLGTVQMGRFVWHVFLGGSK
jgi:hypothetical protein